MYEFDRRPTAARLQRGEDSRLERAIIGYRYDQLLDEREPGGDDLGLALVLAGELGVSADVLDLGSACARPIRLDEEVFILDRLAASSFRYLQLLMPLSTSADPAASAGPLSPYCQGIALGILRRAGFNPITRPVLLRLGFRDLVRDLDPNDRLAVRLLTSNGAPASLYLDCDRNVLMVNGPHGENHGLERLLRAHFPEASPHRPRSGEPVYELRYPLPLSLRDADQMIRQIRVGVLGLYATLEPERYEALRRRLAVFGPRDTLARLKPRAATPATALAAPGLALDVPGVA